MARDVGRPGGRMLRMQKFSQAGIESGMTVLDDAGRFTIAAGRMLEREGADRFKKYGLTVSDVAPLARLIQLGPMTPTELLASSVLLTSAPVVSHSINRLERAGLVARAPHQSDGRSTVVEATDAGREAFVDLHREILELQGEFFAPLSDEEAGELRRLLLRCLEAQLD